MIMPYGDYPFRDLGTYYSLYLMGLYYLFLSSSLLMLSKSNFSLVIPIIIYWVGDVMVSTSTMDIITKIFLAMTINISAEDGLYQENTQPCVLCHFGQIESAYTTI